MFNKHEVREVGEFPKHNVEVRRRPRNGMSTQTIFLTLLPSVHVRSADAFKPACFEHPCNSRREGDDEFCFLVCR